MNVLVGIDPAMRIGPGGKAARNTGVAVFVNGELQNAHSQSFAEAYDRCIDINDVCKEQGYNVLFLVEYPRTKRGWGNGKGLVNVGIGLGAMRIMAHLLEYQLLPIKRVYPQNTKLTREDVSRHVGRDIGRCSDNARDAIMICVNELNGRSQYAEQF
jgi:hypothetical protein